MDIKIEHSLSWKQPYGSLMFHGKLETRTWPTKRRGWTLICTSKQPYNEKTILEISGEHQYRRMMEKLIGEETTTMYGKAIGIGNLVGCVQMQPQDADQCFVKYNSGLWVHVFENVQKIKPFDWLGSLGYQNMHPGFIDQIVLL